MVGARPGRLLRDGLAPVLTSPLDVAMAVHADAQAVGLRVSAHDFEPLVQYAQSFTEFCLEILGVVLWDKQIEIGDSVRDNPRTVVCACYASGKTFTAACLVLWWLYTRRPGLVVTTAPTGRQVKKVLWRELRKLHKRAKIKLPGKVLQTELILSDDWMAYGFSSDAPNSVAGIHEGSVLFIEDEAPGIPAEVVEGFEGITASTDSRHLKIGNPICTSGPFFDAVMHPVESLRWNKIHIDAEETPNVVAGKVVVPHLVERAWVEDKRHRWLMRGLTELWETKVKGRIYVSAAKKVCSGEWLALAQIRWEDASIVGERVLGCDIGAGGEDPTVLYLREGQRLRRVDTWSTDDLMETARKIVEWARELEANRVVIDRTGPGQGAWNRVVQLQSEGYLGEDVILQGIKSTDSPKDKNTFLKRADEIAFWLRDALDPNQQQLVAIDPDDRQLHEEAQYRDWTSEDGKVTVTSKKHLRKNGKKSPDCADAAALACAPMPSGAM